MSFSKDMTFMNAISFNVNEIISTSPGPIAIVSCLLESWTEMCVCYVQHLEYPQEYQQYANPGQPASQPAPQPAASSVQQPQVCSSH